MTGATTINSKIYVAGGVSAVEDPADPRYGETLVHKSLFVYDPDSES